MLVKRLARGGGGGGRSKKQTYSTNKNNNIVLTLDNSLSVTVFPRMFSNCTVKDSDSLDLLNAFFLDYEREIIIKVQVVRK